MNGSLNKSSLVKGGSGGGGGSSTATINFFDGVTGTTLDTQLSLGNAVMVFKNGVLLQPTEDYTISGSTITFVTALEATDKIAVINGNLTAIDLTPYRKLAETITISDTSYTIAEIKANKNYVFSNALTALTFTACEQSFEETTIQFTAGTGFSLTDSSEITWVDGTPTFTEGSNYLILIFNNLAFIREW